MDLAGHEKYFKTTIHGVASGFTDYGLISVNNGCPEHARKQSRSEVIKLLHSQEIGKRRMQYEQKKMYQNVL